MLICAQVGLLVLDLSGVFLLKQCLFRASLSPEALILKLGAPCWPKGAYVMPMNNDSVGTGVWVALAEGKKCVMISGLDSLELSVEHERAISGLFSVATQASRAQPIRVSWGSKFTGHVYGKTSFEGSHAHFKIKKQQSTISVAAVRTWGFQHQIGRRREGDGKIA